MSACGTACYHATIPRKRACGMSATDLASVVCRHSPNPFPHLRRAARRTAQQATRMKAVFIAIVCAVNVVAQIPATPAPIVPSVPPSLAQSLTIQVCESSTRCTAWTGLMGTCVMTSGTGVSGSIIQNSGSAIFTTNSVFWYSDARCTQLAFYFNMYSSNNPLSLERSNNPTSYLTSLTSAGGGSGYPIPVTSAQGIILGSLLVKAQAQQKAVTSEDTSSTPGGANTLAVALYGSPTCASLLTTLLHSSITPGCVAATAYSSTSSFSWSCDGFGNTLIKVSLELHMLRLTARRYDRLHSSRWQILLPAQQLVLWQYRHEAPVEPVRDIARHTRLCSNLWRRCIRRLSFRGQRGKHCHLRRRVPRHRRHGCCLLLPRWRNVCRLKVPPPTPVGGHHPCK